MLRERRSSWVLGRINDVERSDPRIFGEQVISVSVVSFAVHGTYQGNFARL